MQILNADHWGFPKTFLISRLLDINLVHGGLLIIWIIILTQVCGVHFFGGSQRALCLPTLGSSLTPRLSLVLTPPWVSLFHSSCSIVAGRISKSVCLGNWWLLHFLLNWKENSLTEKEVWLAFVESARQHRHRINVGMLWIGYLYAQFFWRANWGREKKVWDWRRNSVEKNHWLWVSSHLRNSDWSFCVTR